VESFLKAMGAARLGSKVDRLADGIEAQLHEAVPKVVVLPHVVHSRIVKQERPRVANAIPGGVQADRQKLFGDIGPLRLPGSRLPVNVIVFSVEHTSVPTASIWQVVRFDPPPGFPASSSQT
jgi:hypothetical protein